MTYSDSWDHASKLMASLMMQFFTYLIEVMISEKLFLNIIELIVEGK